MYVIPSFIYTKQKQNIVLTYACKVKINVDYSLFSCENIDKNKIKYYINVAESYNNI